MSENPSILLEDLHPSAYKELLRLAHHRLRPEYQMNTLNTTGLVHEVYLKMVKQEKKNFVNKEQFYALAAQSMRRILIDYARKKQRQKRGGSQILITLEEAEAIAATSDDLLALDEAISQYHNLSKRGAQIIELWFFAGFKQSEIAEMLGISEATIRREWKLARAWLSREVKRRSPSRS